MTQEEKAKAYDKVREKIAIRFGSNVADEIFSKFEMSEDERIKKEIIVHIKWCEDNGYCAKEEMTRWIAWLEKQAEQKHTAEEVLIKAGLKPYKDGDQWCVLLGDNIQEGICGFGNTIEDALYAFLKDLIASQGEQKPANKVEPRFKNGQWIVWQNKCYKVNYNGCGYELIDQDGLSTSLEYGTIDENAHLFTIQDAKDGDVLVEDSCIFIIQKLGDNSTAAKTYCTLYNDGDFDDGSILYFDIDSTKPATKEQRDTLMKAMADAGWEFDFEKKELKKIEQKLAWSEGDEKHIDSLLERLEGMCKKGATFTKTRFAISQDITWLKSLKERIGG